MPTDWLVGWYNSHHLLASVLESLVPCTGETWTDLKPAAAIFGNSFFIAVKDQSKAWRIVPSLVLDGKLVLSAAYATVDKLLVIKVASGKRKKVMLKIYSRKRMYIC